MGKSAAERGSRAAERELFFLLVTRLNTATVNIHTLDLHLPQATTFIDNKRSQQQA